MFTLDTKKQKKSGFTLIELLVVIAIIGVLASIVLASLNVARRKSRDVRRITDIKQIQLALELFFDGGVNAYPVASGICNATTQFGLEVLKTQGYMPQVSRDPLSSGSNLCYNYATPTTGALTTYHLGAVLEDTSTPALTADVDFNGSAYTNGFHGLSDAATPPCGVSAGTGAETCYDVRP